MGGVTVKYLVGPGQRGADNFNRANGPLGSNWVSGAGSNAAILANAYSVGTPGTGGFSEWVPANPSIKHGIVKCTWVGYTGIEWGGPMALHKTNGINEDSYVFKGEDLGGMEPRGQITIFRRVSGANTQLAIKTPVVLGGFLIGGELALEWDVQPTQVVLNAYVNGILQCSGIDNAGDRITSGKPGIGITTFSGAVNSWDNFSFVGAGGGIPFKTFGSGV